MRYPLPVLFICGLAFAVPSPSHHIVFERRQVEPHGWVQGRRLEVDFMLPMRFGLIQNNLNHLDDMLMVVSHPDSPGYGKHWSATDLVDKFKPTTQTAEDVVRWLVDSGIPRDRLALSINRGWIHFHAAAAQVEELFQTEYCVFTHEDSGAEQISAKFPLTIIYSFLIIKAVKVIQSQLVWKNTLT